MVNYINAKFNEIKTIECVDAGKRGSDDLKVYEFNFFLKYNKEMQGVFRK